jgi:hypothetical protein
MEVTALSPSCREREQRIEGASTFSAETGSDPNLLRDRV